MRLLSGHKLFNSISDLSAYYAARPGYQRVHELVDAARNRLQAYALVGGSLVPLSPPSRRDGGFGVVASVSGSAVTLAAGSTLTSGRVRLWDKSGGVYLDAGGVEGRVSGLTVYLADTTGLAAGDVIHADRLEVTSYAAAAAALTALGSGCAETVRVVSAAGLTIGRWGWVGGAITPIGPVYWSRVTPASPEITIGATSASDLEVVSGSASWAGGGLTGSADCLIVPHCLGTYRRCLMTAGLASYEALADTADRVLCGWRLADGSHRTGGGFARDAAAAVRTAYEVDGTVTYGTNTVSGAQVSTMLAYYNQASTTGRWGAAGSLSSALTGTATVGIVETTYAGSLPFLYTSVGCVWSSWSS